MVRIFLKCCYTEHLVLTEDTIARQFTQIRSQVDEVVEKSRNSDSRLVKIVNVGAVSVEYLFEILHYYENKPSSEEELEQYDDAFFLRLRDKGCVKAVWSDAIVLGAEHVYEYLYKRMDKTPLPVNDHFLRILKASKTPSNDIPSSNDSKTPPCNNSNP